MRVRQRFQQAVQERIAAHLPEALATVWDKVAVVVLVEKIELAPSGGFDDDYELLASMDGVLRLQLLADEADQLALEALAANLLIDPVMLQPDAIEPGDLTVKARASIIDIRDSLNERGFISALRFSLKGQILRLSEPVERPELLIGEDPDIGFGHEGDYVPVEGGGA